MTNKFKYKLKYQKLSKINKPNIDKYHRKIKNKEKKYLKK